ncbi:MAG TPA: hypothetical protein VER11_13440 [Polyangiaceae bacterium]|nr:hypothetical protein [Polyangiaceae bacterium]
MTRGLRYQSAAVISSLLVSALLATACGGSATPAASPPESTGPVIPDKTEVAPPSDEPKAEEEAPKKTPKEEVPEPTFTADMSVDDAINATKGTERMNVDQETMSKPLQDEALYAPCKPGAGHFTFRVAVWRGKAVAIDMTTTPKNPKLAECLKGRIRELTWPAKVPSLNTVEYSM